jgi:hypothetical protein
VFTKDSPVAKGMVMTVEVVKEPWAVPKGLVLAAGQPEARLLWLVVGVRRHEWSGDAPVKGIKGPGAGSHTRDRVDIERTWVEWEGELWLRQRQR